jgi:hypothetical protein
MCLHDRSYQFRPGQFVSHPARRDNSPKALTTQALRWIVVVPLPLTSLEAMGSGRTTQVLRRKHVQASAVPIKTSREIREKLLKAMIAHSHDSAQGTQVLTRSRVLTSTARERCKHPIKKHPPPRRGRPCQRRRRIGASSL